ncbi:MAG: ECF transporter S component [Clostridia bacterium]|nr:ECF transporter S component [Clostridia bacterium]
MKAKQMSAKTLVMGAVMTALVIILQYLGSFIKLGPFSISLVLIPIVIGTATCGKGIGAWLGFVFGIIVLLSGDAAAFLTVNAPGTIITVLLKGTACGFISGLAYECMYKLLKGNSYFSTVAAAIVCPTVNTGIFLLGCLVFFMDTITVWAESAGLGGGVAHYMIFGLVGGNFLVELAINIIFSPIIVRIINVVKKS